MGDTVFLVDKVLLGDDFEVDIAFAKMHTQACLIEGLFLFGIGESALGLPKHVRDVVHRTTSWEKRLTSFPRKYRMQLNS